MNQLSKDEIELIAGGMDWQGGRESSNVIDCRNGYYCTNSLTGSVDWGQTSVMWFGVDIFS
jgi:hypothetical protein